MENKQTDKVAAVDIAVVVPFYQKSVGVLTKAIRSALSQTIADRLVVVIVDDGSPLPARQEVEVLDVKEQSSILLIEQPNGGAGSARNRALNNLPEGIEYVAFLDSDDEWVPEHLENAVTALEMGFDAYFSDHFAALYKDISNFTRIGTLKVTEHQLLDESREIFGMNISMIDHIVADGGGVIGTSNAVYRYRTFPKLRFREEFYNGQDFFFWMDLSDQGAKWCFSTQIHCHCGTGINIYSGSGWGTDKSLQRIRNELFIWTSVERFYHLPADLLAANRKTIRNLKESVVRDLVHRIGHFKPVPMHLLADILKMVPSVLPLLLVFPFKIIKEKVSNN